MLKSTGFPGPHTGSQRTKKFISWKQLGPERPRTEGNGEKLESHMLCCGQIHEEEAGFREKKYNPLNSMTLKQNSRINYC